MDNSALLAPALTPLKDKMGRYKKFGWKKKISTKRYKNSRKKGKKRGVVGGTEGEYSWPEETSPLRLLSNPLKREVHPSLRFEQDPTTLRPSRARKPGSVVEERKRPYQTLMSEGVPELERKWAAVCQAREELARGTLPNERAHEIASDLLGQTSRNLRNLIEQSRREGTLLRKEGSGRPRSTFCEEVVEFIEKQAAEWLYQFTHEAMSVVVRGEFGVGSKETIQRILEEFEWGKVKQKLVPFLTPEHMRARYEHSLLWKDFPYSSSDKVVIHIDEKWFYAFRSGRTLYVPPGVEPPKLPALSSTQIPKVMFLGAAGCPRPDRNFDGKIGLWMVGEEKTAQRKSKFHDKGDVFMVSSTMDGDFFFKMITESLLPSIKKKLHWAKQVEVQMDSAGGHCVAEVIPKLNKRCEKMRPQVKFFTQPTKAPDTNIFDLGIWNSLQSQIPVIRYSRNADQSMESRICNEVQKMWQNYDGYSKLSSIFETLGAVHEEIIRHKGGNLFKLPHKGAKRDKDAGEERPKKRSRME